MIVKNESRYLGKCLESIKDLVDEMIIVDTGSTDNTVEIARKYGANVYSYEWDFNFSNARNKSLEHATMDWILLMDGDDEFDRNDTEKFIQLVNTSQKDGHFFITQSYTGEKPGKDIVSNLNLRLLRNNGKYRFAGAIHEQITTSMGEMDYRNFTTEEIHIFHYGYLTDVVKEKEKRNRNISIIQEELKKDPYNGFHLFNLGNEYFALGDNEKALKYFEQVYKNIDFSIGYSSKLVIRRIMCMEELGRFEEALKAINEGLQAYPIFTDLEYLRGCIYYKLGRFSLAIDSMNRCIDMGRPPLQLEFLTGCGTYRPYEVLGELYYQLEDYHKAYHCFENVLVKNPSFHSPIYRIGKILKKMYGNERYVSYKLSKYFNLEYQPNLVLIANVLMNEGFYTSANGYLEKAYEMNPSDVNTIFLMAKNMAYRKQPDKAIDKIMSIGEKNLEVEMLKHVFVWSLVCRVQDIKYILNLLEQSGNTIIYKTCLQHYYVFLGNTDTVFSKQDPHEKILQISMQLLSELLKMQEFELFERQLNVLNYIESKNVLLQLGKLYYNHGFMNMAVKEILRSVKELDTIDREGIDILYKEFK
ncbi:MAG: glycosyltransferase [Clostridiaceae bacterium]|nr:glycosyltransferase [Clostridiaceae bacterium]